MKLNASIGGLSINGSTSVEGMVAGSQAILARASIQAPLGSLRFATGIASAYASGKLGPLSFGSIGGLLSGLASGGFSLSSLASLAATGLGLGPLAGLISGGLSISSITGLLGANLNLGALSGLLGQASAFGSLLSNGLNLGTLTSLVGANLNLGALQGVIGTVANAKALGDLVSGGLNLSTLQNIIGANLDLDVLGDLVGGVLDDDIIDSLVGAGLDLSQVTDLISSGLNADSLIRIIEGEEGLSQLLDIGDLDLDTLSGLLTNGLDSSLLSSVLDAKDEVEKLLSIDVDNQTIGGLLQSGLNLDSLSAILDSGISFEETGLSNEEAFNELISTTEGVEFIESMIAELEAIQGPDTGSGYVRINGSNVLTEATLPSANLSVRLIGDVSAYGRVEVKPGGNASLILDTTAIGGGGGGGVTSFNTRTGAVTLLNTDVATALGYTPVAPTDTIANAAFATSANNSTNLNGQAASYYLDLANATGTIASARLSGTYAISISGNAATATLATNATNAANAVYANSTGFAETSNTANYAGRLNTARTITLTGDVTGNVAFDGSANVSIATVVGGSITANNTAYFGGQLPAYYLNAGNLSTGTLSAARMPALTGDITTSAGAVATTLATVNSNVGSFGSATAAPTFTVNAKGLVTAAGSVTITPAWSSITSKPTTISGFGITDAVLKTGDTMTGNLLLTGGGTYAEPATIAGVLSMDTVGGDFTISSRSNGGNTGIAFRTSSSGTGAVRMRISSTGDVGIGVTNPAYQLEVGKATGGTLAISTTGQAGLTASPLITAVNFLGYLDKVKAAITAEDREGNVLGGWLNFHTMDTSNVSQKRATIDPSGNFGIGTATPGSPLNVVGGIVTEKTVGGYLSALHWQGNDPALGYYAQAALRFGTVTTQGGGGWTERFRLNNDGSAVFASGTLTANGNAIWHAGNDGPSSGLDADTVDGVQAAVLVRTNVDAQNIGVASLYLNGGRGLSMGYSGGNYGGIGYNITYTGTSDTHIAPSTDTASRLDFTSGGMTLWGNAAGLAGRTVTWTTLLQVPLSGNMLLRGDAVWTAGNDGASSGLDADLLDGQHGSFYLSASNLNAGTLPAARMPALTGDITTSSGAVATTLATVNSNVGSFGSATAVGTFTVNAKGLITAAGSTTITPAWSSITSKPTTISGYGITDAVARASFATSPNNSMAAVDIRNITNPTTGIAYVAGGRFRFSSLNDDSTTPYADVIDLSTYNDSSGGGFNSLYFGKNSQVILHKYAAAGGTSWTTKTVAYTDSVITGSVATLTTGRTLAITGDLTWTSPSFNGSGNVTAAGTLATVNSNVGSFGSATAAPTFTVNAKGLITAAGSATITPAWSSITSKPTTISGFGITNAVPQQDGSRTNLDFNAQLTSGFYNTDNAPTNGPSAHAYGQLIVAKGIDTGLQIAGGYNNALYFRGWHSSGTFYAWQKIWTDSNDGASSGLDADLLDGQQGSFYQSASNINAGTLGLSYVPSQLVRSGSTGGTNWNDSSSILNGFSGLLLGTATNGPGGGVYYHPWTVEYSNSGNVTQFAIPYSDSAAISTGLRYRGRYDGSWTSWNTIWSSGNDGASSGLDADLLDGYQSSSAATGNTIALRDSSGNLFARDFTASRGDGTGVIYLNAAGTRYLYYDGTAYNMPNAALNVGGSLGVGAITSSGSITASGAGGFISATYQAGARNPIWRFGDATGYGLSYFQGSAGFGGTDSIGFHFGTATTAGSIVNITPTGIAINGNATWHAGNDGAGSGLDADLLDGQQATAFAPSSSAIYDRLVGNVSTGANMNDRIWEHGFVYASATNAPSLTGPYIDFGSINGSQGYRMQIAGSYGTAGAIQYRTRNGDVGTWNAWSTIWNSNNDGTGSGLDADLLDGLNSSYLSVANTIAARDGSAGLTAHNYNVVAGAGQGIRFWESSTYSIYMSDAANGTWGGRVTTDTTSDHNMYFKMQDGTNRGFVFLNGTTPTAGIDGTGNIRSKGFLKSSNGIADLGTTLGSTLSSRYVSPGGGSYTTQTSSITGAIKIRLPTLRFSAMMKIRVEVFNYNTNTSKTFVISGYAYDNSGNTGWVNITAEQFGETPGEFNVRFGHDGTKDCIWIGETSSTWQYPQVFITNFMHGYAGHSDEWTAGWAITFETAFNTVTAGPRACSVYWNSINDGAGSGLNADLLDGYDSSQSSDSGNTVAVRDGSGYLNQRVIRNGVGSTTDGMYIGYQNASSGVTRLYGGGSTNASMRINATNATWFDGTAEQNVWYKGNLPLDSWQTSTDGVARLYFESSSHTYLRSNSNIYFMNAAGNIISTFNPSGNFSTTGTIVASSTITGTEFYSGSGNYFRAGGTGGFYCQTYDGGWNMTDGTWIRSIANKGIITGGAIQGATVTATSDRRLKTEIEPLHNSGEIIDSTNAYSFIKDGNRQWGVIAQEVQETPAAILVHEGGTVHEEDGDAILTVDYNGFIAALLAEVKDLRARMAALEARQ